jgi:hypothetical protein
MDAVEHTLMLELEAITERAQRAHRFYHLMGQSTQSEIPVQYGVYTPPVQKLALTYYTQNVCWQFLIQRTGRFVHNRHIFREMEEEFMPASLHGDS